MDSSGPALNVNTFQPPGSPAPATISTNPSSMSPVSASGFNYKVPFTRSRTVSSGPSSPTSPYGKGQTVQFYPAFVPKDSVSFHNFLRSDCHPRKQRYYIAQLKQLQAKLLESDLITNASNKKLATSKDVPRMKSKDLDLPFKRTSVSVMSKFNPLVNKQKIKNISSVLIDKLLLAVRDKREQQAEDILRDIPTGLLRKRFPYESNLIFLTSLANRMETVACMILDRGFPFNVNLPIFSMKASKQFPNNIPFRVNTSLLPSYFIVAVAMNFETLVRFMIKMGADLNKDWNGLTPLHVCLYCADGSVNMNLLNTLLEYGADPWRGLHMEQMHLLLMLKRTFISDTEKTTESSRRQRLISTQKPIVAAESDDYLVLPLMSLPQRTLYRKHSEAELQKLTSSLKLSDEKMPSFTRKSSYEADSKSARRRNSLTDLRNGSDILSKDFLSGVPSHEASCKYYEEWRSQRYIFPLAFAAASGNRQAVLAVLQKMVTSSTAKRRRSFAPIISPLSGLNNPLIRSGVNSRQQSTSTSPTNLRPYFHRMDTFSLLVQQDSETTIYLLKSGVVDLFQTDPKGANALHLACRSGNVELVSILLHFDDAHNKLINSSGENGWTALHEAISLKRLDVFRLLIRRGANPDELNNYGETPRVLGAKIGIDPSDLDSIWFPSPKRTNSKPSLDASSTVVVGSVASDIFNLHPSLLKLLTANDNGFQRKASKGVDFPQVIPMSRLQTYDGVPTDRQSSLDDIDPNKSSGSNSNINSTPNQGAQAVQKANSILKMPFTKLKSLAKARRKDAIDESVQIPSIILEGVVSPTKENLIQSDKSRPSTS